MRAVFLDRDGTINEDKHGYINNADAFELFANAPSALAIFNELQLRVFIVTNQAGIARGYITEEQLQGIHDKLYHDLAMQNVKVDKLYYSPYYSEGVVAPYNVAHEDRKPGIGMFLKALHEFEFSPKDSFMIGDKYADIAFGKKAGMTAILVRTGKGETEFMNKRTKWEYQPDFIVKDVLVAAKLIRALISK